jgi:hypothetical protein
VDIFYVRISFHLQGTVKDCLNWKLNNMKMIIVEMFDLKKESDIGYREEGK